MKQKWFWGTLFFWILLATSVVSWALISTPLRFQPQTISRYETKVNGSIEKTQFWVNAGRLTELEPIIAKELENDHWVPAANGLDLTSVLLNGLGENLDLSDQIQIKMFKKDGIYKSLGLWQAKETDQTYGMTTDIPGDILDLTQAKANWDFPFPPPAAAIQIVCEKLANLKIGFISTPLNVKPDLVINQFCLIGNLSQTLWQKEKDKISYILSGKKIKILAITSIEKDQNVISLVQIKN
ncbi:MAG TPA: hypothetical protein VK791_04655 [bacterium]|jgi:hypothetical protein|nr:hypothetical protein [bacterium]